VSDEPRAVGFGNLSEDGLMRQPRDSFRYGG